MEIIRSALGSCLFVLAPIIYIFIILFSFWLSWMQGIGPRFDVRPLVAWAAGWVACTFSVILILLGKLEPNSIPTTLTVIIIAGFIGFIIGLGYLWLARLVLDNTVAVSLFILGSMAGSSISFLFYVFFPQIQATLISLTVGFLFGVLLYVVLLGGRSGSSGIQDAFRDLARRARRR